MSRNIYRRAIRTGLVSADIVRPGVETIADLEALAPNDIWDGTLIHVRSINAIFYYDLESTAPANGTTVIEPVTSVGRWLGASKEDLASTLVVGNTTGGTDIELTTGDELVGQTDVVIRAAADNDVELNASGTGVVKVSSPDLVVTDGVSTASFLVGTGDPNGAVTAVTGSLFVDTTTPGLYQNDAGGTAWTAVGGGGLDGLTNVYTADYAGFTVDGTNDDLVLAPNGTGAIRARTDGNARGGTAICLVPPGAISADRVAGGYASVAIGYSARTSQVNTVAVGSLASANLNNSIAIGTSTITGGDDSVAVGSSAYTNGNDGIAVGDASSVLRSIAIGLSANALYTDTVAIGYRARADKLASICISAVGISGLDPVCRNATRLNELHHVVELRATTTDATPVEATANAALASTVDNQNRNVVVLANGKVVGFTLRMTAIQETTNDAASYQITGAAKCVSNTASIIGATTTTAYEDDSGWDCTVTCTSNRLVITCTSDDGGAIAPTVYATTWRGTLTLTYEH